MTTEGERDMNLDRIGPRLGLLSPNNQSTRPLGAWSRSFFTRNVPCGARVGAWESNEWCAYAGVRVEREL